LNPTTATTSLRMQCLVKQDGKGNTPLLHVIKYRKDCPDMVRVLVEHDRYGQSLLTSSNKGNIPLNDLVRQAMRELGKNYPSTTTTIFDITQLPDNLAYLLLKTQHVIYLEQGSTHIPLLPRDNDDDNNHLTHYQTDTDSNRVEYNEAHDGDDDNTYCNCYNHRPIDSVLVMQAAICCAHYLNVRNRLSLFRWLLVLLLEEDFAAVDENTNTFQHLICCAKENRCFIEDDNAIIFNVDNNNNNYNRNDDSNNNSTISLLRFLTNKHPRGLLMYNSDGKIPLHVAIDQRKDWKFLEYLISLAPESVRVPTVTMNNTSTTLSSSSSSSPSSSSFSRQKQKQQQGRQLPLHLQILQYNGRDRDRCRDGKASSSTSSNNSSDTNTNADANKNHYTDDTKAIILSLWKMYPDAGLIKDATTNLYPFQSLAAAKSSLLTTPFCNNNNNDINRSVPGGSTKRKNIYVKRSSPPTSIQDDDENQSSEQLSIIYQFLREAPEVLRLR